jgi:ribonuclease HI
MNNKEIIVFTDGSARGNPGPGGFGVIAVLGDTVQELGGKDAHTTNNRMELMASIEGLSYVLKESGRLAPSAKEIKLYTDSTYLIKGITQWVFGWKRNNWQTAAKEPVVNRDLWERLLSITEGIALPIRWNYVSGHAGIPANERVDEVATEFADDFAPMVYGGSLADYPVDILDLAGDEEAIKAKKSSKSGKARSQAKAYSYISIVKGDIMTHATWAECEKRVRGAAGARFKKALTAEEEKETIESFKNS